MADIVKAAEWNRLNCKSLGWRGMISYVAGPPYLTWGPAPVVSATAVGIMGKVGERKRVTIDQGANFGVAVGTRVRSGEFETTIEEVYPKASVFWIPGDQDAHLTVWLDPFGAAGTPLGCGDPKLASWVSMYQSKNGLPVTGRLDAKTIGTIPGAKLPLTYHVKSASMYLLPVVGAGLLLRHIARQRTGAGGLGAPASRLTGPQLQLECVKENLLTAKEKLAEASLMAVKTARVGEGGVPLDFDDQSDYNARWSRRYIKDTEKMLVDPPSHDGERSPARQTYDSSAWALAYALMTWEMEDKRSGYAWTLDPEERQRPRTWEIERMRAAWEEEGRED